MSVYCRATYEAVVEAEELGDTGCPLCGFAAEKHVREDGSEVCAYCDEWRGPQEFEDGLRCVYCQGAGA